MPPFGLGDETAKLHAVMVRLPVFLSSTVGLAPETRRPANGGSEATSAAVMANAIRKLIAVMLTCDSRIAPLCRHEIAEFRFQIADSTPHNGIARPICNLHSEVCILRS